MNQYINTLSNDIANRYIKRGLGDENKLIDIVRKELFEIKSEQDQLALLTIILEANETAYQKHLEECLDRKNCETNKKHERVTYYLQQELREIGFQMNDDYFSSSEKEVCNTKLDEILQTIINANEVVFDHVETLRTEIEELKNLYILGKKNWKQQFAGKMTDMTLSGVVSELTAKPLIEKVLSPSIEFIQNNLLD
jgi:uncharacterized protein YggL (DUF469 family)